LLVRICTSTPRASAARSASRAGHEVTFGVRMVILRRALAKRVRSAALSGVIGGLEWERKGKKLKRGFRWCEDGRNRVGTGDCGWSFVDCVAEPSCVTIAVLLVVECLPSSSSSSSTPRVICRAPSSASAGGAPQTRSWNVVRRETTSPSSSMHPSNHLSQLTLQLGTKARTPSIKMYLGCMTLSGVKKMLLTVICIPPLLSVASSGRPSLVHREEGYV